MSRPTGVRTAPSGCGSRRGRREVLARDRLVVSTSSRPLLLVPESGHGDGRVVGALVRPHERHSRQHWRYSSNRVARRSRRSHDRRDPNVVR